ncbi:MAG: Gfo/Idh/MocA family oxidoreductase, partial [Steroidobacteraceae bacterium]
KKALWRTDPRRSGAGGSIGDIGTHAAHLARYITGLRVDALCADLTSFVKGRRLDDDASMLLRFGGGAKGVLHCSQISVGEDNDLNIRVYGEKASLEWHQEHPDELTVKHADKPREIFRRGGRYASAAASRVIRVPAGHPEGYLEAFGNIYREAFRAIRAEIAGKPLPPDCDFPTIDDGVDGMRFVEAALESSRLDSRWVKFPTDA